MAQAYSMDLRERVLKDSDAGMRSEAVAAKYSVSASWVYDLRKNGVRPVPLPPSNNGTAPSRNLHPMKKRFVNSSATILTQHSVIFCGT